jgi:hypothetical protein
VPPSRTLGMAVNELGYAVHLSRCSRQDDFSQQFLRAHGRSGRYIAGPKTGCVRPVSAIGRALIICSST